MPQPHALTRFPLGPAPERIGELLDDADPRVWESSAYAALAPDARAEKTRIMRETFGEVPIFYAQGRGRVWEQAALLFRPVG